MGLGAVQGRVCYLDLVPHGIQPCHMQEDHCLSPVMVSDLIEITLTAPYSLRGRRRAPQRSRSEPAEYIGQLPAVVRPPSVFGSALPGVFGGGGPRVLPVHGGL